MRVTVFSDGAARGNPGPAAIGVLIVDSADKPLAKISRFLGQRTNNQAEYAALIAGLETALALQADEVEVVLDSELVARQMTGQYRVCSKGLLGLFQQAQDLARRFKRVSFRSVPRHQNRLADELANQALDRRLEGEA